MEKVVTEKVSEASKRYLRALVHYKVGKTVTLPMLGGKTCTSKILYVQKQESEVWFLVEHCQGLLPHRLEDQHVIKRLNTLNAQRKYLWLSVESLLLHNKVNVA